jgi:hypothetical protein
MRIEIARDGIDKARLVVRQGIDSTHFSRAITPVPDLA